MAVKRVRSDMDVVTAAQQRIKNVFSNGVPVYLSFSGGKDSIVLADLTYKLIQAGEIDPSLLTVLFVDEEAIYDQDLAEEIPAGRCEVQLVVHRGQALQLSQRAIQRRNLRLLGPAQARRLGEATASLCDPQPPPAPAAGG